MKENTFPKDQEKSDNKKKITVIDEKDKNKLEDDLTDENIDGDGGQNYTSLAGCGAGC